MRKNKNFKLKIEDPCSASWESMTIDASGRFCNSCQKSVIDFTTKTRREITEILKNSDSKTCGRFTARQLEEEYTLINTSKIQSHWYQNVAVSLLVMLGAKETTAQSKASELKQNQIETRTLIGDTVIWEIPSDIMRGLEIDTFVIEGRVVDEEDYPVPYFKIKIEELQLASLTDIDGFFRIEISAASMLDKIHLYTSDIEFEQQIIEISKQDFVLEESKKIEIKVKSGEVMFMGLVYYPKDTKQGRKKKDKSKE